MKRARESHLARTVPQPLGPSLVGLTVRRQASTVLHFETEIAAAAAAASDAAASDEGAEDAAAPIGELITRSASNLEFAFLLKFLDGVFAHLSVKSGVSTVKEDDHSLAVLIEAFAGIHRSNSTSGVLALRDAAMDVRKFVGHFSGATENTNTNTNNNNADYDDTSGGGPARKARTSGRRVETSGDKLRKVEILAAGSAHAHRLILIGRRLNFLREKQASCCTCEMDISASARVSCECFGWGGRINCAACDREFHLYKVDLGRRSLFSVAGSQTPVSIALAPNTFLVENAEQLSSPASSPSSSPSSSTSPVHSSSFPGLGGCVPTDCNGTPCHHSLSKIVLPAPFVPDEACECGSRRVHRAIKWSTESPGLTVHTTAGGSYSTGRVSEYTCGSCRVLRRLGDATPLSSVLDPALAPLTSKQPRNAVLASEVNAHLQSSDASHAPHSIDAIARQYTRHSASPLAIQHESLLDRSAVPIQSFRQLMLLHRSFGSTVLFVLRGHLFACAVGGTSGCARQMTDADKKLFRRTAAAGFHGPFADTCGSQSRFLPVNETERLLQHLPSTGGPGGELCGTSRWSAAGSALKGQNEGKDEALVSLTVCSVLNVHSTIVSRGAESLRHPLSSTVVAVASGARQMQSDDMCRSIAQINFQNRKNRDWLGDFVRALFPRMDTLHVDVTAEPLGWSVKLTTTPAPAMVSQLRNVDSGAASASVASPRDGVSKSSSSSSSSGGGGHVMDGDDIEETGSAAPSSGSGSASTSPVSRELPSAHAAVAVDPVVALSSTLSDLRVSAAPLASSTKIDANIEAFHAQGHALPECQVRTYALTGVLVCTRSYW